MISVSYTDFKHIEIKPDNSDENSELMQIFAGSDVFYRQGSWYCHEDKVDWINIALIPVKKLLYIDKSFKEWRARVTAPTDTGFLPANIRCGVITSFLKKGSQELPYKEIEAVTRYFFKGALHSAKYKSGKWDGYINLYHKFDGSFPTGLLSEVKSVLIQKGIEFKVMEMYDTNPKPQFSWVVDDGLIPDPDQVEAVLKCVSGKRGICKAPTGFGKTAILAKRLVAAHGVPALFVANKKTLLDDAKKEFESGIIGLTGCSTIKDGWFGNVKLPSENILPLDTPVVVATIQSLSARLKDEKTKPFLLDWLRNTCKLLMVDESQAVGTETWDEVLNECKAPYRIFLSATPRRTDGATIKLMAGSGPILFTTTAEEQIEKGRLCELEILYKTYNQRLYNDFDADLNYQEMYKACITENEERNQTMIVTPTIELLNEGRHVLVLIQHIDHGHRLREMFVDNGIPLGDIRFIWGDTPDKMRQSAITEFRKGEFKIMIGSTIFDAGVNIPIISGVVLGGAGNSDITLIQRIGRGARNCDYGDLLGYIPDFMKESHGKKVTKVIDIMDINAKFFHKQALNRYYNARDEFGKSRVHCTDSNALKRQSKTTVTLNKSIDQMSAQLDMLNGFSS